jgi:hypothetical protein
MIISVRTKIDDEGNAGIRQPAGRKFCSDELKSCFKVATRAIHGTHASEHPPITRLTRRRQLTLVARPIFMPAQFSSSAEPVPDGIVEGIFRYYLGGAATARPTTAV